MTDERISCPGLDGSNPLTLLAALGLFGLGARRGLVERMGWEWRGSWTPFYEVAAMRTRDDLVAEVLAELAGAEVEGARRALDSRLAEKEALDVSLRDLEEQARHHPKGAALRAAKQQIADMKARSRDLKSVVASEGARIDALARESIERKHPVTRLALHLDDETKGGLSRSDFVKLAADPAAAPYLAGLACDGVLPIRAKSVIARTHLSFANNNSGKMLIKDFAALARLASRAGVEDALFGDGSIREAITGLGWDPETQRSYALQFSDPGKAEASCQVVRNALAFMGLEFFTVVPTGSDRATVGFHELQAALASETRAEDDGEPEQSSGRRAAEFLTWPIWEGTLGIDEVKSLIVRSELAATVPDARACRSMGIAAVLRSRRVSFDKRSYFAQARPVA
jgi:hypothetical protein